jgi:hypothetical protein
MRKQRQTKNNGRVKCELVGLSNKNAQLFRFEAALE